MSAERIPSTAKRGDTIAIVTTVRDYVIGRETTERQTVELATAVSCTRDGVVKGAKSWAYDGCMIDLTRPDSRHRVLVVPAAMIDAEEARALYVTRRYPSAPHSTMVPPFDSIEEARDFLRPFLVSSAA